MCLLKRVLPFALALTIGVILWAILDQTPHVTCNLSSNYGGIDSENRVVLVNYTEGGFSYDRLFNPREVDQKAQILWRLELQYPEEAIANRIKGTVVVQAIVTENGWARSIRIVSDSPESLSFKAAEATGQMKFSPAIKDGHPVSQYVQIEYNFNLH